MINGALRLTPNNSIDLIICQWICQQRRLFINILKNLLKLNKKSTEKNLDALVNAYFCDLFYHHPADDDFACQILIAPKIISEIKGVLIITHIDHCFPGRIFQQDSIVMAAISF